MKRILKAIFFVSFLALFGGIVYYFFKLNPEYNPLRKRDFDFDEYEEEYI